MAATSTSSSSGSSSSSSTPGLINSPASDWELQLAQYLQQVGNQQMQWAAQEYARAGRVTDAQINNYISTAQQGSDMAGGMIDRYNSIYAPATDQYAREAGTYASNGRIQHEMGRAESGVMQAGRKAEINAEQELQSFGIDPSSGRYQDLVRASKTADAAAAAGAGETARRQVEGEGTRRKETAIAMGQQLPGAAVNSLNSAYQGIAGAENAALGLANTGVNLTTSPSKFFDPAMGVKYPPVGTTSAGRSSQGSQSGSVNPGGGSGGGNRDPFNSDRFGRPSGDPGGAISSSRGGQPAYSNPNGGATYQNPNASIGGVSGNPDVVGMDNQQPGLGDSSVNPWDSQSAQDPYQWGAQGGQGITADNYGGNFDGTPPAPADWGGTDQSAGQGWWGGTPQTSFPDAGGSDPYAGSYGGGSAPSYDNSNWGSSSGWDPGLSTPDANWGGSSDNGSSGYDNYYAQGGGVVPSSMSPSGGQQTDDVPAQIPQTGGQAQINVGEFVIPKDVALWKGQEFFQKMIAQSRKARMGAPAKPSQGPSRGGPNG